VPVVRIDRESIEVRDLPFGAVALLDLLEFQRHVDDRRVDLARQEVRRAQRSEDFRDFLTALRDDLKHQQERDDARVGFCEVPEVVVR
jgi:hypothetical protein